MSVGTNIRLRRIELHMSQQQLADAMGYHTRSTIAKIESGENDVTQKKLMRFAAVLDTTPEALYAGAAAGQPAETEVGRQPEARRGRPRRRTVAVLLAGGRSVRNHQNIPNQFISILGKPVIVYCMEAYQAHPAVDDICVVCLRGWESIVTAYAEEYGITKLRGLIPAAASGILSVQNGLNYAAEHYGADDVIIFQESTRPMVSVEMISKLLQACEVSGSANICQSMKDNVQFLCANGRASYIDRDAVVDLQSPEAYHIGFLREVFREAQQRGHGLNESCCAMLLYNLGYDINFIQGSVNNIKIVRQEDVAVFEALLRQR